MSGSKAESPGRRGLHGAVELSDLLALPVAENSRGSLLSSSSEGYAHV